MVLHIDSIYIKLKSRHIFHSERLQTGKHSFYIIHYNRSRYDISDQLLLSSHKTTVTFTLIYSSRTIKLPSIQHLSIICLFILQPPIKPWLSDWVKLCLRQWRIGRIVKICSVSCTPQTSSSTLGPILHKVPDDSAVVGRIYTAANVLWSGLVRTSYKWMWLRPGRWWWTWGGRGQPLSILGVNVSVVGNGK